jgi:SAM-dependent methyltransferase
MSLSRSHIIAINRETNERYDKRLREKGPGAFALGWGNKGHQVKRFKDLIHAVGEEFFQDKRVVDIGCGLGDLYPFLRSNGIRPKFFLGVDVNEAFIRLATEKFFSDRFVSFEARDLVLNKLPTGKAQTGVALGVINYKQKNHKEYAKRFIATCYASVSESLVVNVISLVRNKTYEPESRIFYYDPAAWLAWAQKNITPYCSLIHDYAGEPQHEFFLILRKRPWKK